MLKFATVLSTLAVLAFAAPAFAGNGCGGGTCDPNNPGGGGGCGDKIACPTNGGGNGNGGGCGDKIACPTNGGGNGGGGCGDNLA